MLWIPITLAAATFQVLRTSRQHGLRSRLSPIGAGFVRYLYAAPLALTAVALWFGLGERALPAVPGRFWPIIAAAGLAQIAGTVALLRSFRARDFALGTVYAKTEVIQVAIVGAVLLGEPLEPLGWVAALVCTLGVAWLAGHGDLGAVLRGAGDPAAALGIAAGGLFGLAAVGIRGASRTLGEAPPFDRALVTLAVMLTIQTLVNGGYLAWRDRAELGRTLAAWRLALPVGLLSLAGSTGWAWAVTLENAAKVRTLGQVELVLAFALSHRRHEEAHTRAELLASALVLVGVVGVVLLG
jgi:drug/metabolite transporter (DMT)-like permease